MRGVLIFSGYNHRGIIAFCRYSVKNAIPFFIVASSYEDLILFSDYKSNVIVVRQSEKLKVADLIEYKNKILKISGISSLVILPSTEFLNRFLLENQIPLESEGYVIPLCSKKLYETLSDKYSFGELCRQWNLDVPSEYDNFEAARIPFVAKPKGYFVKNSQVNKKPVIVTNETEYNKLKETRTDALFYQEFVEGNSYYLLYYFSRDGTYSVFSQENLMQQHNGLSIIAAQSFDIHHKEISAKYGSLLSNLGYTGLIMIEIRFSENKFYMIEANPRLWGPSQLILDSGMDLFDRFAYDNELITEVHSTVYKTGQKYFWSGGIIEDQKQYKTVVFHHYRKEIFFDEYISWYKADIYLRPDTRLIYFKETN